MRIYALLITSFVVFAACPFKAHAQDPLTKLGRGMANVLTGWVEIPKSVNETADRENSVVGGTLRGFGEGTKKAIQRAGSGFFEILTFPFPGEQDYGPIVEPEFVFSPPDEEPSLARGPHQDRGF